MHSPRRSPRRWAQSQQTEATVSGTEPSMLHGLACPPVGRICAARGQPRLIRRIPEGKRNRGRLRDRGLLWRRLGDLNP